MQKNLSQPQLNPNTTITGSDTDIYALCSDLHEMVHEFQIKKLKLKSSNSKEYVESHPDIKEAQWNLTLIIPMYIQNYLHP